MVQSLLIVFSRFFPKENKSRAQIQQTLLAPQLQQNLATLTGYLLPHSWQNFGTTPSLLPPMDVAKVAFSRLGEGRLEFGPEFGLLLPLPLLLLFSLLPPERGRTREELSNRARDPISDAMLVTTLCEAMMMSSSDSMLAIFVILRLTEEETNRVN